MPVGQAPPAGAAGVVLLGCARLDDSTVSRSLFPACLHTCKHSLHNKINEIMNLNINYVQPSPQNDASSGASMQRSALHAWNFKSLSVLPEVI
jgi:hypothetical protein